MSSKKNTLQNQKHSVLTQLILLAPFEKNKIDCLFSTLLLASALIFLMGNLLVQNMDVLRGTFPIALISFALLFLGYSLSNLLKNVIWSIIILYGFLFFLAYFHPAWLIIFSYGIFACAFLYTVYFLRVSYKDIKKVIWMAVTITVVFISIPNKYAFFDILQAVKLGNAHIDTLFHASIAAMIKNYGVTSTGLHGLVETPYHAFSHTLMAGFSVLSNAPVLQVYGVATWMFFVPMFIFCATVTCEAIKGERKNNTVLTLFLVCALLILFPKLFWKWAFWDSYFLSESYLVAIGFLLLGLQPLFNKKLSFWDVAQVILLATFMSAAKGSVGLIYAGIWLLRALFLRGHKIWLDWVILGVVSLLVGWVVADSAAASAPSGFYPLSFITKYSWKGNFLAKLMLRNVNDALTLQTIFWSTLSFISFFLFHFFPSWGLVIYVIKKHGYKIAFSSPAAIYSLGVLIATSCVIFLFDIPGGSAYYFTNITFFVSLPFIINNVSIFLEEINFLLKLRKFNNAISVISISIVLTISVAIYIKIHKISFVKNNQFFNTLQEIRIKENFNIYFVATEKLLAGNPITDCRAKPFVYPALSERAWVGVIDENSECNYEFYGYAQYGISHENKKINIAPVILENILSKSIDSNP